MSKIQYLKILWLHYYNPATSFRDVKGEMIWEEIQLNIPEFDDWVRGQK
jgi:hypothetical protein